MDVSIIGKNISTLRREKGIKQEELARVVGVSAQAVSKWERGGAPDCELLPMIADYFGVSIDSLFDRTFFDSADLRFALQTQISSTPEKERFDVAFEYCWEIEKALFGLSRDNLTLKEATRMLSENERLKSALMTDLGYTQMGLEEWCEYFLLVPDIKDSDKALFDGIDYVSFFADIADRDVFEALCLLYRRDSRKSFTVELLTKALGISESRAEEVLGVISKYRLVEKSVLELDEDKVIYNFKPTQTFVALLIFAHEMISPRRRGSYLQNARKKPYLN
ncbi:MAG: helix-turn-helix transcriptional regulator [Ruminococcaceae bacterium]|nr:helix-turn-helix transcriptional regulator [Oscillospiraceae bacterium]